MLSTTCAVSFTSQPLYAYTLQKLADNVLLPQAGQRKGSRTQQAVVSNLVGPVAGNATSTVAFVSCTGGQKHQLAKPHLEICSKARTYSKAVYYHT